MKKFGFLVFLSLGLMFFGCGDDAGDVSGTYDIIFLSTSQCDDPDLNGSYDLESDNCVMESGIELCIEGTFTLASNGSFNGSFTITTLGFTISEAFTGTYTVDGNNITICDETDDCETGMIDSNGSEITLRFPEDEDNCILVVTGKK